MQWVSVVTDLEHGLAPRRHTSLRRRISKRNILHLSNVRGAPSALLVSNIGGLLAGRRHIDRARESKGLSGDLT